ncbi:MAG: dienelactone hydrolase [Acidimicrobiales bacterium]|nr:dienelactone hydrolase [Acidimicrobiales bacterium]
MALREYLIGEVTEDFDDGLLSRREALRRLSLLGVGLSSAGVLLAACGSDDSPPQTEAAAPRSTTSTSAAATPVPAETIRFTAPSGEVTAAYAAPADPRGSLLVIHENKGLTPHFVDLVGRFAGDGWAALCVDLVSPEGGTAKLGEAGATAALGAAPVERLVGDLRAGIDELERRAPGGKVGAVGFCFGGGMTWQLLQAGESRLAVAVPFYGPAPDAPDFSQARAAVLAIYGELDARVNASQDAARAALDAAGLTYEIKTYAGADHAFFNDTGPRYNEGAATQAKADLDAWLEAHLA